MRTPRILKNNGYRQPIPCKWCKHSKTLDIVVGSQSFMRIIACKKADEHQVNPEATCDKAER